MSVSDRDALLDVWAWSGGPLDCPGVFKRPSRMSETGWKVLPDVRE